MIGYCLGQGFKGIARNKAFFIASVATITACVFLVGLFASVFLNFNYIIKEVSETVCVTVFFDEGTSDERMQEVGDEIESWNVVSYVEFTSAEEAWENFQVEYFADNPELAEGFADDNPLANSASYEVYLTNLEYQSDVVTKIESMDDIRQVNQSEITAGALTEFGTVAGIVSMVLIAVLLIVSIFLITNTIITGITVRKGEIQIMKYVGATDFFVKFPFVFEGMFIGIIGAIIPLIILYFIYNKAISYVAAQLDVFANTISFLDVWVVYTYVAPVSLIIGAGIGFIGSMIATGRHIKV